jgi:hypothetical protein
MHPVRVSSAGWLAIASGAVLCGALACGGLAEATQCDGSTCSSSMDQGPIPDRAHASPDGSKHTRDGSGSAVDAGSGTDSGVGADGDVDSGSQVTLCGPMMGPKPPHCGPGEVEATNADCEYCCKQVGQTCKPGPDQNSTLTNPCCSGRCMDAACQCGEYARPCASESDCCSGLSCRRTFPSAPDASPKYCLDAGASGD